MSDLLYGGAFDPPHIGHQAVAAAAQRYLSSAKLILLVSEHPGHKQLSLSVNDRVALVRAAFPGSEVEVDPYQQTVELLRKRGFDDPTFVVGADQFCDFLDWQEPDGILERSALLVVTRPGFAEERFRPVLSALSRPERVAFLEMEPVDVSSTEVRARLHYGADVSTLLPAAVAKMIERGTLYSTV